MQAFVIHPAKSGRQKRSGVRQSMPSRSMASCAGQSVTKARGSAKRGRKIAAVDTLGEQAEPRPIPKKDLQERSILTAEDEQMTRERCAWHRTDDAAGLVPRRPRQEHRDAENALAAGQQKAPQAQADRP